MKRFWRDATFENGTILLDGRPVRTPGRAPLTLPTAPLAEAIAGEWAAVGDTLDPRAMTLTGLANAAIDRISADPAAFAAGLARYGENDLLCYRADSPAELVAWQAAAWDPWLGWASQRYDVHFEIVTGIVHRDQPTATIARLHAATARHEPFALAALSPLVTTTGSLVLALALAERAAPPDAIWQAATADETWQATHWGEDADARAALEAKHVIFAAAARFLELLDTPEPTKPA